MFWEAFTDITHLEITICRILRACKPPEVPRNLILRNIPHLGQYRSTRLFLTCLKYTQHVKLINSFSHYLPGIHVESCFIHAQGQCSYMF